MKKGYKPEETQITALETEMLLADIQNVFGDVIKAISEFDDVELNKVPFPGSWTAGQVVEHIIRSSGGIPDQAIQETDRGYDEKDEAVKAMFSDMDRKFEADISLRPGPGPHDKYELIDRLIKNRSIYTVIAEEKDLRPLCMGMELPDFGFLTRYEWIRFILHHTTRHTTQMRNIRKSLNRKG